MRKKQPQNESNEYMEITPEQIDDIEAPEGKGFHVRAVTVVLVAVFLFIAVKFTQQYMRIEDMRQEAKAYEAQYNEALAEQEELLKEKELLQDDDYIERLVREKLGLVKDGEILVVETEDSGEAVEYDSDIDPADIH